MVGRGSETEDELGVYVLTDVVDDTGISIKPDTGSRSFWQKLQKLLSPIQFGAGLKNMQAAPSSSVESPNREKKGLFRLLTGTDSLKGENKDTSPYLDADKVLHFGKHRLVVGVLWSHLAVGTSVRETASIISIDGQIPDLYVLRRKVSQVGFAFRDSGIAHGDRVAATGFSALVEEDWVGVFEIEWRKSDNEVSVAWWLVGHRDGEIIEDKLIYDQLDAETELKYLIDAANWTRIISPKGWSVANSDASTLKDFLSNAHAARLTSLNRVRANVRFVVPIIFLIVAVVVGYMYWQHLQEQERLLREMEQRQRENARLASLQTPPWVGTPTASEFVRACMAAIETNLMFVPGWNSGELVCDHDAGKVQLTTSWTRAGGRVAWIMAGAQAKSLEIDLNASLNNASTSYPVDVLQRSNAEDIVPLASDQIDQLLRLRFDTLLVDGSISQTISRSAPRDAREQGAPIWNFHSVTFRTSASIDEYLAILSDVPAVVPERFSYNATAHEWGIGVRIYHPPIGGVR
jgi:hypothetical protein